MSLVDDVIFVLKSDQPMFSEKFHSLISKLNFGILTTPELRDYWIRAATVRNVFDDASSLLTNYLFGIHRAVEAYNLSYFVTQSFSRFLVSEYQINRTISEKEGLIDGFLGSRSSVKTRTLASLWFDIISPVITKFDPDGKDIFSGLYSYFTYEGNQSKLNLLGDEIKNIVMDVIDTYRFEIVPSADEFMGHVSLVLFGSQSTLYIDYARSLWADGNGSVPIETAEKNLYNFLEGTYIPLGLDQQIWDLLLSSYTSNRGNLTQEMVMSVHIDPYLARDSLPSLFEDLHAYLDDNQLDGVDILILNQYNYLEERDLNYERVFRLIDFLSVIISFSFLWYSFKSAKIGGVLTLLAWSSSFSTVTILSLLLGIPGHISSGGLAITNSILFGAAINFTVFYSLRFFEGDNLEESLHRGTKALHSIQISALSVFGALLPITISSYTFTRMIALGTAIGIVLQLGLLSIVLPSFFSTFMERFPPLPKSPIKEVNLRTVRRNALMIVTVALLAVLFLYSFPGSLDTTDAIANSGDTGGAYAILDQSFPPEYFNKLIVQLKTDLLLRNPDLTIKTSLQTHFSNLSATIAQLDYVTGLFSFAWPLGVPLNLSNHDLSKVDRGAAVTAADQLISLSGNETFMIVQLADLDSLKMREVVKSVRESVVAHMPDIVNNYSISGLPVMIEEEGDKLFQNLLPLTVVGVLVLTLTLGFLLKSPIVPVRLEFNLIAGSLISVVLGSIIWFALFGSLLNMAVVIFVVVILLALGTDFEVYLYTRVAEGYNDDLDKAIEVAYSTSSKGIELSGKVMAFSFLALLLSDVPLFRQFGLVIFISILLDVYVVRKTLLPASMLLFKKSSVRALKRLNINRVKQDL